MDHLLSFGIGLLVMHFKISSLVLLINAILEIGTDAEFLKYQKEKKASKQK